MKRRLKFMLLLSFFDYFYFEVKDSTKTVINYEKFEHDISLKGEFIRLVNNEISLSDEQKEAICKLGIKTIFGGDI